MVEQSKNKTSAPVRKKAAPKKKSALKKKISRRKAPAKKKTVKRKAPVKKRATAKKKVSRKSSSKKAGSSASTKNKSKKSKELSLHKDGSEQFTTSDELFTNITNYAGRPTKHSIAMENKICGLISIGYSLSKICSYSDMPAIPTVFLWLNDEKKEGFLDKYAQAREMQTEILEDQMVDIADNASQPLIIKGEPIMREGKPVMTVDNAAIQHARLRIDTRTRHMEVTKPKKWGRNLDLGEGVGNLLSFMDEAAERVANYKREEAALIDNDTGLVVND